MEETKQAGTGWRLRAALIWCALLTLFFAGWIGYEQSQLAQGFAIAVRPQPVDPRDLLRGQYLILTYDFSRPGQQALPGVNPGDPIWAVLRQRSDKLYVLREFARNRPESLGNGEIAICGRMAEDWGKSVVFGIEKFFIPEGTPTPAMKDMTVHLRVAADGQPRIEHVKVNGKLWP